MKASPLLDYAHNIYSQSGEDGILEKILTILPSTNNWCVEFGAWDGLYLSNTANLLINRKYNGVLIEADEKKYLELKANYRQKSNVTIFNDFVGWEASNNLDSVLNRTNIPLNFDFLSIDIDGNDIHVWKAMSLYRPKVVCVEYNPTIPTEVEFAQIADASVTHGASLRALVGLGNDKKYELIAITSFNAFFVQQEYYRYFKISDNSIQSLRIDTSKITYLFQGYDGKMLLSGARTMPWHYHMIIPESGVQVLPRALRLFPEKYTLLQKVAFFIHYLLALIKL